jgi:Tol biopolymer transport system component
MEKSALRGATARRLTRLVQLAAYVGLVFALHPVPASAKHPVVATNGRIAFGQFSGDLWTIRPNGSDQQLLASLPTSASFISLVRAVSFSADGSRLAVLYEQIGTNTPCTTGFAACWSIVLMGSDGNNQHFVYSSELIGSGALALSPDGRTVAFTLLVGDTEPLFSIDFNGRHLRQLTTPGRFQVDLGPTWSPDGKSIAFQSNRDCCADHEWGLYIVNAHNRHVRKVMSVGGNDLEPDWSPDGSKLVFIRTFAYPDYRIYSVDVDGTRETEILRDYSTVEIPHWSPDGEKIVFLGGFGGLAGLFVVDADGADATLLHSGESLGFDWRPNY